MDIDKEPLPTRLDTTEDPPRIKRWDVRTNTWAEDGVLNAMARALRLAAAALHAIPRPAPEYAMPIAGALVAVQAAVAMAEGRPFDSDNTDLMNLLRRSRDSIAVLLARDTVDALGDTLADLDGKPPRQLVGIVRQTHFDLCSMIGGPALAAAEQLLIDGDRSIDEPERRERTEVRE